MSLIPPWKFSEVQDAGDVVLNAPAHQSMPYIKPKLYGREEFPEADASMPQTIKYLPKKVSLYKNKILIPRRIVMNSDQTIHFQSFRRRRVNYHGGLIYKGNDLYEPRRDDYKKKMSKISYPIYYVDTEHPDIFGHFLLEVLPDVWGYHLVEMPDMKLATSVNMTPSYLKILYSLGINSNQILHIDGPIAADEIFMPTPAIVRRRFVDPISRDIFHRVSKLAFHSNWNSRERIYVSRSHANGRELLNEVEVEKIFYRYGFSIIHPQEMLIEDQIKAFRDAKMIAGTGGSAMHNALYSDDAKVLILATETWFVLADSFICNKKDQLGYVFGKTTTGLPGRHKSEWTIDLGDVEDAILRHFSL